MKAFKFIAVGFMLLSFMFMTSTVNAQDKKDTKTSEVKIKVMFHCVNGKALLEKDLVKEPGVSKVVADVETKVVTVTFDGTKTDRVKINSAIEKIGYQTELTPKDKKINKACSHEGGVKEAEPKK